MILVIKNIQHEGPGLIESFFVSRGYQIQNVELAQGDVLPNKLNAIDAIFVMGGPMNVYEKSKYPYLVAEEEFLRKAVELGIPVMGICLGAQLMAKAFGAKVTMAPKKEIGWDEIELNDMGKNDKLFSDLPQTLDVFQWHGDMFDVPGLGVLLGKSKVCNQVFKLGEKSYALQFHIEVTPEIIESWFKNSKEVTKEDTTLIKNMTKEIFPKYKIQAEKILSNFLEVISK